MITEILKCEDGVYLIKGGFIPVRFKDSISVCILAKKEHCNVIVSYHGHKWIVCKRDMYNQEYELIGPLKNTHRNTYKSEVEALNEFDMKSCTERLRKVGLIFELDKDLYIPTLGQLMAMFLYQEELNKALKMVGGNPMEKEVYWSSSEYDVGYNWSVSFFTGKVNWYISSNNCRIRPCKIFNY